MVSSMILPRPVNLVISRGESRTAPTSKMELFVIIVNGVIDPPVIRVSVVLSLIRILTKLKRYTNADMTILQ